MLSSQMGIRVGTSPLAYETFGVSSTHGFGPWLGYGKHLHLMWVGKWHCGKNDPLMSGRLGAALPSSAFGIVTSILPGQGPHSNRIGKT